MAKVLKVKGMSRLEVENKAEDCIRAFFPQMLDDPQPFPLEKFLDSTSGLSRLYGFEFYVDDDNDVDIGTEGFINPLNRELVLPNETWTGLVNNDGRCRFTVAHEIGHTALHADQINGRFTHGGDTTLHRRADVKPYEDPEWQANTFASALLMPLAAVRKIVLSGGNAYEVS